MDTLKIVGAPESSAADELQLSGLGKDPQAGEILALADWEMVLVAGGDVIPCWP